MDLDDEVLAYLKQETHAHDNILQIDLSKVASPEESKQEECSTPQFVREDDCEGFNEEIE